jgi:hypothetical protein
LNHEEKLTEQENREDSNANHEQDNLEGDNYSSLVDDTLEEGEAEEDSDDSQAKQVTDVESRVELNDSTATKTDLENKKKSTKVSDDEEV